MVIFSNGLHRVRTVELNAAQTAYESGIVDFEGETQIKFTPKRTVEELPSGDNPEWAVVKGPVTGDLEITLYDIPLEVVAALCGCKYSSTQGFYVGDVDDPVKYHGVSFVKNVTTDGVKSENKFEINKVRFDLPEIEGETVTKDKMSVAKVVLKGSASPVYYTKANGKKGARTYRIINSVTHAAAFNSQEPVHFPSAEDGNN